MATNYDYITACPDGLIIGASVGAVVGGIVGILMGTVFVFGRTFG